MKVQLHGLNEYKNRAHDVRLELERKLRDKEQVFKQRDEYIYIYIYKILSGTRWNTRMERIEERRTKKFE